MVEQVPFKISSGLKNIIGKELITSDFIAIFELVKNSYDANAKEVKIVFQNIKAGKNKDSRIYIIDDGVGMSETELKNKWLFIGYSEKKKFEEQLAVDFRDKAQKQRLIAGAKGIGRFSCDKLGSKLKLYSKKTSEKNINFIKLDWSKFEVDQKKELHTIKVDYSTLEKIDLPVLDGKFNNGTILEISELNEPWEHKKLVQLKRHLQRLINPIDAGDDSFKIIIECEEFKDEDKENKKKGKYPVINGPVENLVFENLKIKTTHIHSRIDEKGERIFTELIDKEEFIFSIEEENKFKMLKNIDVKVFFLNPVAKANFKKMMGIESVKFGSIFLYKNIFRIHPYGDERDDWLGLEKRRVQGFTRFLSSRELMGRIIVSGNQQEFKEVSSRAGGVVETKGYFQLQEFFIKTVLRRLERYVVEGIGWDNPEKPKDPEKIREDSLELVTKLVGQVKDPEKKIKFNENLLNIFEEKQVEKLPQLIKNLKILSKYAETPEQKEYIQTQLKSLGIATRTLKKDKTKHENEVKKLEGEIDQKEKEILFYKDNTPGTIDLKDLAHLVGTYTNSISDQVDNLYWKLKGMDVSMEIIGDIDKLRFTTGKISTLANIVTRANFKLESSFIEKDLVTYTEEYLKNISPVIDERLKIDVDASNSYFVTKFKPLEVSMVIDNLLSNSKKANSSRVKVKFKNTSDKKLVLRIFDNGRGIHEGDEDKIFNLGFSTTGGTGIGLNHVKRILGKSDGDIKFIGNGIEVEYPGAGFEVIFNAR